MAKKIIFAILILVGYSGFPLADDKTDLSRNERELREIGSKIKQAVLKRDVSGIMEYVSDGGIVCIDTVMLPDEVLRDFQDHDGWLYCYFFSHKKFSKEYKSPLYPMGLDEFFRKAKGLNINVRFMEIDGKLRSDWGCIRYKSSNIQYVPEFCFFKENEKWGFVDFLTCS